MNKKRYYEDIYENDHENTHHNTYGNTCENMNEFNIKRYKSETKYIENNIHTDQILLILADKMNKYDAELSKLNNDVNVLKNDVNKLHQEINQIKKENKKYRCQLYELYSYMGIIPNTYTETPSYIS